MKEISSEKKILKEMAELNYYALLGKIDEANSLDELQKFSEALENESRELLQNVCLSNG